ncbi:Ig-like domain-containing protein [Bacillus gaemokensis]|uniref:Ig-like domain-containing protein n=1 Tax=Bacillus gaemokensis TaxID=574375 RepID=UPI00068D1937|nr:Ig-like domain-containing protein [Bacillus gaemokensis]KYG30256.1 hypothetical protein AZF08_12985 [Bacillus gaemokensis]
MQMAPSISIIAILYRFSWRKNLSFCSDKADMNQEFSGTEDLKIKNIFYEDRTIKMNLKEKKCIQSVGYIDAKIMIASVTHSDKYVTGHAEPHSTIVLIGDDMVIGSGRVDKYGKFSIHTYNHLKDNSIIKAQVIFDGFYQDSITIHVN